MLELQITAKKGFFREFLKAFNESKMYERISYTLEVDKETHETKICFTPVEGIEEISMQDFKIVTDLISRSEV